MIRVEAIAKGIYPEVKILLELHEWDAADVEKNTPRITDAIARLFDEFFSLPKDTGPQDPRVQQIYDRYFSRLLPPESNEPQLEGGLPNLNG